MIGYVEILRLKNMDREKK